MMEKQRTDRYELIMLMKENLMGIKENIEDLDIQLKVFADEKQRTLHSWLVPSKQ